MANEIRVNSWSELQDQLFEDSWNPRLERYRSRYVFRGLSESAFSLETTLMRVGGNYTQVERHLLRNFRKYAHRNIVERDSIWNWLSVAKHYGLPARLLDWSYSPLIALHFATANLEKIHLDGAIWAVNNILAHQMLPEKLKLKLEQEGSNVFTIDMLAETVHSLEELASLSREEFVIFFEPPSLDDRIINQYAFFSVMPNPRLALDQWLKSHPEVWKKIIIPADLKWEIRDKLDQANINERVLFPGLDGLSQWLKRHYSPKGGCLAPTDEPVGGSQSIHSEEAAR